MKKIKIFAIPEEPIIYNTLRPNHKVSSITVYNEENTIQTRNKFNEELMSKNKLENDILLSSKNVLKKPKRKRKIKTRIDRMEKDGNEINNQIVLFKNNREENPNDANNIYNQSKEYNLNKIISNEVIKEEENSSESDSSDSGNILSEKADEKIINDTGEVVNKIRSNKYTFMKELPNNPNFILCRSIEMEIIPENINLPQIIKKQKKTKNYKSNI